MEVGDGICFAVVYSHGRRRGEKRAFVIAHREGLDRSTGCIEMYVISRFAVGCVRGPNSAKANVLTES